MAAAAGGCAAAGPELASAATFQLPSAKRTKRITGRSMTIDRNPKRRSLRPINPAGSN